MLQFTFEYEGKSWVMTPMLRWAHHREPKDPTIIAMEWGVKLQQYCYNESNPDEGQWFDIRQEDDNE